MDDIRARLAHVEAVQADNAAILKEIRDVVVAARYGFKVLNAIGAVFKWGGIISAGALGLFHGAHSTLQWIGWVK